SKTFFDTIAMKAPRAHSKINVSGSKGPNNWFIAPNRSLLFKVEGSSINQISGINNPIDAVCNALLITMPPASQPMRHRSLRVSIRQLKTAMRLRSSDNSCFIAAIEFEPVVIYGFARLDHQPWHKRHPKSHRRLRRYTARRLPARPGNEGTTHYE